MRNWCWGCVLLVLACSVRAQEVTLRHALKGPALDALATLTLKFNDSQKGKAKILLQDVNGLSEQQRPRLPDMALLDIDDSPSFFATRPRFLPLYQVMRDAREGFDASGFYPQIADAVDDAAGRIQALPLALSLPLLYWNKEAFKKAGLDPQKPPRTWNEALLVAGKLYDARIDCPLTSANFSALHVENLSSQHGESLLEGRGRFMHPKFNTLVNVKHLAMLSSWQKSYYFRYFGPRREAEERFVSGECSMITDDSTLLARLGKDAKYGVAAMPYHDDVYGATPSRVLPDGMSLWVLAGKKKEEYKVVARFVHFLLEAENQRQWVKATAFLPMGRTAMTGLRESGLFDAGLLDAAELRLSMPHKNTDRLHDALLRSRMHSILSEEFDALWAGRIPPKEALDTAMVRLSTPEAGQTKSGKKSGKRSKKSL